MAQHEHSRGDRQPHAYGVDRADRERKARKVADLIEKRRPMAGAAVLDVGCGSGWMAHAWSEAVGSDGSVTAIDLVDQRRIQAGYSFTLVEGTGLPFADQSFDVAISNHVIEHVGDESDQRHHLSELHRVLRPDGTLYLAVPNRWRLMEPHFGLPGLSWLPQRASDAYLRVLGRGDWYDVEPPSSLKMRRLWNESNFLWENVTLDGVMAAKEHEKLSRIHQLVANLPSWVLGALGPVMPTFIYLASPA